MRLCLAHSKEIPASENSILDTMKPVNKHKDNKASSSASSSSSEKVVTLNDLTTELDRLLKIFTGEEQVKDPIKQKDLVNDVKELHRVRVI